MKNVKKIALSTAALVSLGSVPALAQGFTSHHEVAGESYAPYVEDLSAEQKLEVRKYLNYEQREPCQFYRPIPEGFVRDGCDLVHEAPPQQKVTQRVQARVVSPAPKSDLTVSNILTDYEINFAFDSSVIEPAAVNTLDRVASEIQRYKPREVTVSGHADKAGPSSYNIGLSEKRAQAVSNALNERGITNRILSKKAFGESKPAVNTKDGVALRENRRVVVEFRK